MWKKLTNRRDRPENEPQEIAWLRAYSNYLTPKLGLGSADTWAAVALMMRNLLLNWLVILPALWVAIVFLKGLAVFLTWIARYSPNSCFLADGEFDPSIIFARYRRCLAHCRLAFPDEKSPDARRQRRHPEAVSRVRPDRDADCQLLPDADAGADVPAPYPQAECDPALGAVLAGAFAYGSCRRRAGLSGELAGSPAALSKCRRLFRRSDQLDDRGSDLWSFVEYRRLSRASGLFGYSASSSAGGICADYPRGAVAIVGAVAGRGDFCRPVEP